VLTGLRDPPPVSRPVLTFLVRITRERGERLRGTVERVRTGRKERFRDAAAIGGVIERMLEDDHGERRPSRREEDS
jgi:hypothetical protein